MTTTRFIALLIMCISASMILFAGCNTNEEPATTQPPAQIDRAPTVYDGEESFQNRCAVCHGQQADGTANRTTSSQPPLRNRPPPQLLIPQRRQQRRDRAPLELRRHAADTQRRTRRSRRHHLPHPRPPTRRRHRRWRTLLNSDRHLIGIETTISVYSPG